MMGGAPVSWYARRQEVVALSSIDSEYVSLCSGVKEVLWIRLLMRDLKIVEGMDSPTVVNMDKQGGIKFVHTESVNRRTKHIDVRYHFTRQAVQEKLVELAHVPTEHMLADMMTKALGRVTLEFFMNKAGLARIEASTD